MAKNPKDDIREEKVDAPEAPAPKRTFKRTSSVTRPVLKMVAGATYYVTIEGEIHVGDVKDSKEPDRKPADVCNVLDLDTGEHSVMICFAVLKSELEKHYPDNSYIGKSFEIKKFREGGKNYNLCSIFEIEVE